jgi:Transposase
MSSASRLEPVGLRVGADRVLPTSRVARDRASLFGARWGGVGARWPEILAFPHTGITNAGSEGTNRVIKTIARDAYGFRNPGNQRLRTRCATTRRVRGHLDAR